MSDDTEDVFRLVAGLWISPDLSEASPWLAEPSPLVDHDAIDYVGFVAFLERHFYCGELVALRLPDDTVDQLTVDARSRGASPDSVCCHDFAERLLAAADDTPSPIAVRQAWAPLHRHKDRRHAPPPALLMFLIEGAFEAVTIWQAQASMRLGIRAGDLSVLLSGRVSDSDLEGHLTPELGIELERHFGVPFLRPCRLAKMASTPPPSWATPAAATL